MQMYYIGLDVHKKMISYCCEGEKLKGNANSATLAVARKMEAYLPTAARGKRAFVAQRRARY